MLKPLVIHRINRSCRQHICNKQQSHSIVPYLTRARQSLYRTISSIVIVHPRDELSKPNNYLKGSRSLFNASNNHATSRYRFYSILKRVDAKNLIISSKSQSNYVTNDHRDSLSYLGSLCSSRNLTNFNKLTIIKAPLQVISLRQPAMSTSNNQNNSESEPTTTKERPRFTKTKEELKAMLTPLEYKVTQEKATERPFTGEYCDFKEKGTYHCVVCNEELFTSETKFESGCGWPAFFDSVDKSKIKYVKDFSLVGPNILLLAKNPNLVRTEILCSNCDAHLGHIFDDGPKPTRKRYCVNSASLRFVKGGPGSSAGNNEKL